MNINAQELMLVRRNMKFGETKPNGQPAPTTEPTNTTAPDAGMKALELQAKNNIAFQGTKTTILNKIRQKTFPYVMTGLMAVATPMIMTSCENIAIAKADSEAAALLAQLIELQKEQIELLKQQLAYQELSIEIQKASLEILEEQNEYSKQAVETGKATLAETKKMNETLTKGISSITSYLKSKGATDAQILAALNGFRADADTYMKQFLTGQITYMEYLEKIAKSVEEAKQLLQDLLTEVQGFRSDVNRNFKAFGYAFANYAKNMRDFAEASLANDEREFALLDSLNNNQKDMVAKSDSLIILNNEMLEVAKDPSKFNQLMENLDSMKRDDEEFQAWIKDFAVKYGLDLNKLLRDWKADDAKAQKAIIDGINNNGKKLDKLSNIVKFGLADANQKLSFITRYLPQLKQDSDLADELAALAAAIDKNTAAIEENTNVTEEGLAGLESEVEGVNNRLDIIIAKFDKAIDKMDGFTNNFEQQQNYWINVLGNLEKGNQILDKILNEQKVTNETLNSFKGYFDTMVAQQKISNSYLNILSAKQDELKDAINKLEINVDGGMTRDEFLSAMEERDAKRAKEFEDFIKKYGFDKVPGDVQTIKEFLEDVNSKLANVKDYSGRLDKIIAQGDTIIDKLENGDFSDPEVKAWLKAIYNEMDDICKCGNESIPGSDDLNQDFN